MMLPKPLAGRQLLDFPVLLIGQAVCSLIVEATLELYEDELVERNMSLIQYTGVFVWKIVEYRG